LSEHLTPAESQAALRKELSRERWREVVRHLLRGCAQCRAVLGEELHPLAPERESEYDRVLEASFESAFQRASPGDRHTGAMGGLPAQDQGLAAAADEVQAPVKALGGLDSLFERSYAMRYDDPREMVRLTCSAVELALGLDPAVLGARRVADQQARAWGELANAYRVAENLWEAQRAFANAFQLLERGTGDRLLKARLFNLHASLLGTQRKFALALEALDVVYALYLEVGDVHLAGRSLIAKAKYLHSSGRPEEALALNERGLSLIDETRDPALPAVAVHNHLSFLVACGNFLEARELLSKNRHLARPAGQVMATTLHWVEGQIHAGLGSLADAEAVFLEVKEEFERLGLGFGEAVAALDLALVWMRQGRVAEAEKVVIEAAGVFAALDIHREAVAAVHLLKEAFRIEKASVELIAQTVAFLREWEPSADAYGNSPSA